MSSRVFYFTATGNSLAFARDLAAGLGETDLVPIARALTNPTLANTHGADRVGLVFPVIAWGMPLIVDDFVRRLRVRDGQYVFAVATCGGTPGNTLRNVAKTLRANGGHLDAGFTVREPVYLQADNGMVRLVKRAAGDDQPQPGAERLAEITGAVRDLRRQRPEVSRWAAGFLGDFFHGMSIKMVKTSDRAYHVDEHCVGCGTCERVCPRANIRLAGGKPKWHGNCGMCQACLQWCPQGAIQMADTTHDQPRNHRPGVSLDDMLVR